MLASKKIFADTVIPDPSGRHIGFLFVLVLLTLITGDTFKALYHLSSTREYASHLLLVPLISIYFAWSERQQIFREVRWDVRGLGGCSAGLALHIAAKAATDPSMALAISTTGIIIAAAGCFHLFYGPTAFHGARFSLRLLVLMIPLPTRVLDTTISTLQWGSAALVEVLLRITDVAYFRDGLIFQLPGVTVTIATECSGIRSSVALLLVAILASHMYLRTLGAKLVLCALAIPLAILKNAIRIYSLITLASSVDPWFLTGPIHHRGGVIFFGMALLVGALVLGALRRIESPSEVRQ